MADYVIKVDEAVPLLNEWLRMHWQARRRYMKRLAWMIREHHKPPGKPLERCTVHVDRYSAGLPDWDGLYGGLKSILDCLVMPSKRNPHGLGFIRDDSLKVIKRLTAEPRRCSRGEGYTIVTIKGVE